MSKRKPVDSLGRVILENALGEFLGMFQILQCEKHGNVLHFTDVSGSDNCAICVKSEIAEAEL